MLYKRGNLNSLNRIESSIAESVKKLAFEASRIKPEDANPLARRATFFEALGHAFRRIWTWLGFGKARKSNTMLPYNPPRHRQVSKGKRGRTHNANHITPPRAFGSSRDGAKLSHRLG